MNKVKLKFITLGVAAIFVVIYWKFPETFSFMVEADSHSAHMAFQVTEDELEKGNVTIEKAFKTQISDLHVQGMGVITHITADGEGIGAPQRFTVNLSSGLNVEVSYASSPGHPPIRLLLEGGEIQFSGTYEWNSAGGKITNTVFNKKSPSQSGWIKYNDLLSQ